MRNIVWLNLASTTILSCRRGQPMLPRWKRQGFPVRSVSEKRIIRVEPLSTYLEKWKAPTSAVTRWGDTIYVSGLLSQGSTGTDLCLRCRMARTV